MDNKERKSIEQFNKWANTYDRRYLFPFFFSNKFVLRMMKPMDGDSVLDIGCGTGILLQQLSQLNINLKLYGMDIATNMANLANKKLHPDKAFIQIATSHNLPYKRDSFKHIICANSFHHYSEPQQALGEMFRVLKKKSQLFLLDPFTNGFFRKIICKALNTVFQEKDTHLYSKERIKSMFIRAGFKNIEQKSYLKYKLLTIGNKL